MKPYVHEIEYRDPIDACAPLRDTPMTLLLHGTGGRWSYIAANPIETIIASADEGRVAFARARDWIADTAVDACSNLPPFSGGVAGLVGYEMARAFERAPRFAAPDGTPDLALGLYDCVAAFDHGTRRAFVVTRHAVARRAQDRAHSFAHQLGVGPMPTSAGAFGTLRAETALQTYETAVATIIAHVRAGDLYQANISRRYTGHLGAGDHPFGLFSRLATQSPAPFTAYMRLANHALVSNSPERFLSVSRRNDGLHAFSQPIKGTRPRGATPVEDEANARALLESKKDRAENLMIVDLMRNDLSKTCAPGSVRVPRLCGLESYANVHHLVSDIEGRLRDDADAFDLFAGAFPPGSITGAPKVKAMELIGAHEGAGRGPYCGSLAWLGFDGAMDSSVLIRTATCTQDRDHWRVAFNVGAGIVADSDPAEEAQETITKAASLTRAITGQVGDQA